MSRGAAAAARLVTGAAAALAACSNGDDRFSLHLVWNDGADQSCRPLGQTTPPTCSDLPMTCGAWARIRFVDADDPTLAYFSQCFRLDPGGDACKLGDLTIPANSIPNKMVKVQVMVWADQTLAGTTLPAGENCPTTTEFGFDGLPMLTDPLPAIAGEAYFPVGKRRYAEVVLGCPDSEELAACTDTSVRIVADVQDPRTLTTVVNPSMMQVELGVPKLGPDEQWRIDPTELVPMVRTTTGVPGWATTVDAPPTGVTCVHALRLAAQTTPALTCFPPPDLPASELRVIGYHADPMLVDSLLDSLLLGGFPSDGLVLGIVVDHLDAKVAGAQVTATRGTESFTVVYPEVDFSGVRLDQTTANGLFLSFDAPYDATWTAIAPTGIRDDGRARGGLVADTLSVVKVRLQPAINPVDGGTGVDAGVDAGTSDAGALP